MKRSKHIGGGGGVQFSRDPYNPTNVHSRKVRITRPISTRRNSALTTWIAVRWFRQRQGHRCRPHREGRSGHQQEVRQLQQARRFQVLCQLHQVHSQVSLNTIPNTRFPLGSTSSLTLYTGPSSRSPTRPPSPATGPISALPPLPAPVPSAGPRGPSSLPPSASPGVTPPRRLLRRHRVDD